MKIEGGIIFMYQVDGALHLHEFEIRTKEFLEFAKQEIIRLKQEVDRLEKKSQEKQDE